VWLLDTVRIHMLHCNAAGCGGVWQRQSPAMSSKFNTFNIVPVCPKDLDNAAEETSTCAGKHYNEHY